MANYKINKMKIIISILLILSGLTVLAQKSILKTGATVNNSNTFVTKPPPPGISVIEANTSYTDVHHSVIDPKLEAEGKAKVKPFEDFMDYVSEAADAYLATGDKNAAQSALTWLDTWASDKAMLGTPINDRGLQAIYESMRVLSGLSLAYYKVQPEATPTMQHNINQWLIPLAVRSKDYVDKNHNGNNHEYWAALGIMVTGVVADRKDFIRLASDVFDEALNDIKDDGSLPREMARGQMALTYHSWASAPLMLMAEVSRKIGKDWYARKNHRLSLLADLVVSGLNNQSWFNNQTGFTQKVPTGPNLAWLELYRHYSVDPQKIAAILVKPSYAMAPMGGNLTEMAKLNFFGMQSKPSDN